MPTRADDLRMLPSAATAWLSALAVVRLDWRGALVAGGALLVVTTLVLLPIGGRRSAVEPGGRGAVALALGVAAVVLLGGGVQQHSRGGALLARAVGGGWVVEVTGRLDQAPQPLAGTDRCRFQVDAQQIEAHGGRARAASPVEVQAPCVAIDVGATVADRGSIALPTRPGRVVAVLHAGRAPVVVEGPAGPSAIAARMRAAAAAVSARVPGEPGALLPAIAWGDTSRLPLDLTQAMQAAGLTHVTAVSGAHFALVSTLVLAVAAALRAPRAARAGATVLVGLGLIVLVGPQPSVLRAAVMGAVAVVGVLVGRPASGPSALAVAVVGLLVADPWLAGEAGFALSVAATAGLVLLGPGLTARWSPWVGHGPASVLAVPLVAQLSCAPLLLGLAPAVATWAVPANLLAAPAIGPATVLGLGSAVLAPLWPTGAVWLADGGAAACWWIVLVAHLAAGTPVARLAWLPGTVGVLAMVAASAGLLGLAWRAPGRGRLGACPLHEAPPPADGPAVRSG